MLATNINKELLLIVMKVADVYEFTISKTGDRPVDMVSVDGKKYKLTIQELISNFTTLQGKQIKVIRLTKNKQYLATKLQNTPCYAVKIPKGSNKQIEMPDGHIVGPGKVIVIHANKLIVNGDTVDISNGTVMTEAFFRKTCVLKEVSETFRRLLVNKGVLVDDGTMSQTTIQAPTQVPVQSVDTPVQTPITPIVQSPTQYEPKKQEVVLGKIVGVIKTPGTGITVGYTVFIENQLMQLDVEHTMQACDEGLIENATTVVNGNTGKKFLRGIGIRLEDLPISFQ